MMPLRSAAGIRDGFDFRTEVGFRGFVGHVGARAGDVELPPVVDAPQPFFFVATEEQGRAPMRAMVLHEPDVA